MVQGLESDSCQVFPNRNPSPKPSSLWDLSISGLEDSREACFSQTPCFRMDCLPSAGPDPGNKHAVATFSLARAAPETEPATSNAKQAGEGGRPRQGSSANRGGLCYDGFRCGLGLLLSLSLPTLSPRKAPLLLSLLL